MGLLYNAPDLMDWASKGQNIFGGRRVCLNCLIQRDQIWYDHHGEGKIAKC